MSVRLPGLKQVFSEEVIREVFGSQDYRAPRTLIFGTCYAATQPARYVVSLWAKLVRRLNPGCDIWLIDSASSPALPTYDGVNYFSFEDNIGHLSRGGRDGWGRAWSHGVTLAVDGGYDYVAHVESDLLFALPVAEIVQKMEADRVLIAAPIAAPYPFMETALMFVNCNYARRSNLVERYDWQNPPRGLLPEDRMMTLAAQDLSTLRLRGCRNDLGDVSPRTLSRWYPNGVDWITHADAATLRAFLEVNSLT